MVARNQWSLLAGCSLVAALAVLLATPLDAQTTDPDTPASSPLWWTLTDEVSPQELRRSVRDRKDNLRRYLEALDKGEATAHPPEQLEYLSYFHAGALHPELLPMWEAFDAFALRFRYHEGWDEKAPDELRPYGISTRGIETVIATAHEHLEGVDRLIQEIGDEQGEFISLARKAGETLGDQPVQIAMKNRRADVIANATGQPLDHVRKLMDAWAVDPTAATAEELLPQLRTALGGQDWQNLRQYLLREIAPGTSAIDFDYSERIQ